MNKSLIIITFLLATPISQATPTAHSFHHPEAALKAIAGKADAGAKIYQAYCANCHAQKPLIPMGAPQIGDKAQWQARMKKGMKAMFQNAALGINNMPARGGCFECSDKLLQAAIDYMLPKKKAKKVSE